MTATYNSTLPTNKDHVRFLIGDTNILAARLSDEEILAVLSEESATGKSLKYFAAASCLSALLSKWGSQGEGELEREVDDFRIRRGIDESAYDAVKSRIRYLREKGSFYLSKKPRGFRILAYIMISIMPSWFILAQVETHPTEGNREFSLLSNDHQIVVIEDQVIEEEDQESQEEQEEEESSISSIRSSLVAAGWCEIVSSQEVDSELESDYNIGCDIGLGLRLAPLYKSLSLVGVLGSKSVGIGIAHTILDNLDSSLTYSIAIGVVAPYDSNGIYSDGIALAIGTNIGIAPTKGIQ